MVRRVDRLSCPVILPARDQSCRMTRRTAVWCRLGGFGGADGRSWNGVLEVSAGKWALTATMTAAVFGFGLSGPGHGTSARLTRPTSVALDFHDRTVAEVVKAIENRSGKRVAAHGATAKSAVGVFQVGGPSE